MKYLFFTILIVSVLFLGFVVFSSPSSTNDQPQKNNVSIQNGFQYIEISAKGGYTPRKSVAQGGLPTILRVDTNGTFDCSSTIRIPSLNISRNLPQTGVTDISLGTSTVGLLKGTCGMGMYPFEISFN